jgi:long-chain acyl-CoA synthetase
MENERPMSGTAVRALLERQAALRPLQTCFIAPESGCRLDFAELLQQARGLAHLIAERGLPAGSHIAWLLPNGPQVFTLFIGCMAAGHVATPLSLLAQPEQLAYLLEHSDCHLLFVAEEDRARVEEALRLLGREIPVVVVDAERAALANPAFDDWPSPPPEADAPALLMYTSGTTGRPKGVLLSHGNITAGAAFVSAAHRLTAADRVLAVLPMYHINAQIVTALSILHHGGSLVMPQRFSVGSFWRLAAEYHCTWLNVVPTMLAYLLETAPPQGLDLSALRFCRSASAPLPPEHHRAFEEHFGIGIIETMGLTETAAPVFTNPLDPARRKIGSPGQAFGNAARVVDALGGEVLDDGQAGEIQIRGPNVMAGYYKASEESAKALTGDGWLRTGDLGYRDADGFYFITGRLKELIIKGGENIAPREIDEVLLAHPAVLEAACAGMPDPFYGQEILAGIVLRPGAAASADELSAHCRARLGPYKTPRQFRFLDELPKGPSGKVQRLKLLD